MVYGLWQSAAGLSGQEFRQGIAANNLANVETPGFRPDRVAFLERLVEARERAAGGARHPILDRLSGGQFETKVYTDHKTSPGPIVPSGNPFDVAIEGDGFLTVRTADGTRYTRDGRLLQDPEGTLRHATSGGAVLDAAGQPVVVDRNRPVKISADGTILQGDAEVARLGIVDFADRNRLEKTGDNLLIGEAAGPRAIAGRVRQGAYEGSGVDAITTLVEMIGAARAYEANAKMITLQDESLSRVVNQLGRLA